MITISAHRRTRPFPRTATTTLAFLVATAVAMLPASSPNPGEVPAGWRGKTATA